MKSLVIFSPLHVKSRVGIPRSCVCLLVKVPLTLLLHSIHNIMYLDSWIQLSCSIVIIYYKVNHIKCKFFCSQQLKREFPDVNFPPFPPKKLLSLNSVQLEERRLSLERYLQTGQIFAVHHPHTASLFCFQTKFTCVSSEFSVSQSPSIASSDLFNGFLLSAQHVG